MIRPTQKTVLAFFISAPVAALIVAIFQDRWYLSFYYPAAVTALVTVDVLAALWPGRVEVTVTHPKEMFLGSVGAAKLTITTGGYQEPVLFEALLEATGEMELPQITPGTSEGGVGAIALPILPRRRGRISLEKVWLRWKSRMAFVEFTRTDSVDGVIDVVPDVKGIYDAALRFFARDAEYGVKSQRTRGDGTEFDDLRDYAPGMDNRFIDWKSSARHRKILCKEFRQERNHHVMIGFDTGRLMTEPLGGVPKLDRAIRAGLLLGWVSLYYGDFLGGCAFDVRFRNFVKPGRGMRHFTRFQRFAAGLTYRTEETNFTLGIAELNSRLTKRTLVVLFTEFVDAIQAELLVESLGWMTRKHVVLFVSLRDFLFAALRDAEPKDFGNVARAVIADDFLRERRIVLERIARMGVHCLDVTAAGASAALLNRYLMIKQKGLL
jgi:uncharacterized protein (DUF58 family)